MSDLWKFSLRNNEKNNSKMRAKRCNQSLEYNGFIQQQNQREIEENEESMEEEVDLLQLDHMSEGFDLESSTDSVELPTFTLRDELTFFTESVELPDNNIEYSEDFESVVSSNENFLLDDGKSFTTFSSSDSETNFEELEDYYAKNDYFEQEIYLNSEIKYKHFIAVFVSLFGDFQMPDTSLDKFLKFIRAIVPQEKLNLPKTYKSLKATFSLPKVVNKIICGKCSDELLDGTECSKSVCKRFKNLKKNKGKKDPILTEFNFVEELKLILSKQWPLIMEYKTKLDSNEITDICNSNLYKSKDIVLNSISLILFIDGAQFNKSENGSIWAILGIITNLPPKVRSSFANMLKILFINGRIFDFNGIFDKHMSAFNDMVTNGVKVTIGESTMHVAIYIHGIIGDAPCRAKTCYCKQHNGIYGCFHCLCKCHTHDGKKYIILKFSTISKN